MAIEELIKNTNFKLSELDKERLQIGIDKVNDGTFWDEYSEQEYNMIFRILHMHYEEMRDWDEDDDTQYEDYLLLMFEGTDVKRYDDFEDMWNDFVEIARHALQEGGEE